MYQELLGNHLKINIDKEKIFSKSVLGAILFAFALWGYTSLNQEYTTMVKIPLRVSLPENRAMEKAPPDDIVFEVRGGGWDLFNLYYFSSAMQCIVDLSKKSIVDSIHRVSRNEILNGVQDLLNARVTDIRIDYLDIISGKKSSDEIPIIPNVELDLRDGFVVVGDVEVDPPLVKIKANDKIIRKLKTWSTAKIKLSDLHRNVEMQTFLSDSLSGVVELKPNIVTVRANLQQAAEYIVHDMPIKIRGGSLPKHHEIKPSIISVAIRGGIKEITKFKKQDLVLYIDYNDIKKDKSGIIIPKYQIKGNFDVIGLTPGYVYHYIEEKEGLLTNR